MSAGLWDTEAEQQAERSLYVVPECESEAALKSCGFDAIDATNPVKTATAAKKAAKEGRVVVVVGQPDDTLARWLASTPGIVLRELSLPPSSSSVWGLLGYMPSFKAWGENEQVIGRITWVTWAMGSRAVAIQTAGAVADVKDRDEARPFDLSLVTELPGLLGEVTRWMIASSIRPQPALCLGSAIATLGAVMGQRVATETDLRTNVYCLGIGETACGKDASVSRPSQLLMRAGLHQFVGPGEWKSDSGLRAALQAKPSHVALLDEFTKKLAAMTQKGSPHLVAIREKMLEVFSKASSLWLASAYADVTNRPPVEINCPNLCVYGTGVPSELFAAMDRSSLSDGFLNRWLVFMADDQQPARQNPGRGTPPAELVASLQQLHANLGSMGSLVGANPNAMPEARIVPWADDARDRMAQIEDLADERVRTLRQERSGAVDLWVRFGAHVAKLALIRSVAIDHQKPIGLEDLAWAERVVLWCGERMAYETETRVADSPHEAATKRVLREIVAAGPSGIRLMDLTRSTQWLQGTVRRDILHTLEESGQVTKQIVQTAGRPTILWRAAQHAGPQVAPVVELEITSHTESRQEFGLECGENSDLRETRQTLPSTFLQGGGLKEVPARSADPDAT